MDAVRVPLARTRPVLLGNIEQTAYHTKICLSLLRLGKIFVRCVWENLCTLRLESLCTARFARSKLERTGKTAAAHDGAGAVGQAGMHVLFVVRVQSGTGGAIAAAVDGCGW